MFRLLIALAFSFSVALPVTLSVFALLLIRLVAFLGLPLALAYWVSVLVGGVLEPGWIALVQSLDLPSVSDSDISETVIGVYAIVYIIVLVVSFLTVGRWINRFFSSLEKGHQGGGIVVRCLWVVLNIMFAMVVLTIGLANLFGPEVAQDTQAVVNLFYVSTVPGGIWGVACGTILTSWINKLWNWVGDQKMGYQAPIPVYIRNW